MIPPNDHQPTAATAKTMPSGTSLLVRARPTTPEPQALSERFVAAVLSQGKIVDCPHHLYKYPARFAPEFAREAIREFSVEGDLVADPFCGGGTAIIEAVAQKRRAVGFDISSLACFLARAKTTPLSIHDQRELEAWSSHVARIKLSHELDAWEVDDTDEGYYRRNLPDGLVAAFGTLLREIKALGNVRQQKFARLVLLSVGQLALDCKTNLPDAESIRRDFCAKLVESLTSFRDYTWCLARRQGRSHLRLQGERRIIHASAEQAARDGRFPTKWGKVKLVVTSPPYPGVHMLYHRWQLLGRRETPAPFLLANCRDGDGVAHYNLGGRHAKGLTTYFDRVERIFSALRSQLHPDARVVQMVAFNHPEQQLPAYLAAMTAAGYQEIPVTASSGHVIDGRLWRPVPGRKWYAATRPTGSAGKEVVLVHRPMQTS